MLTCSDLEEAQSCSHSLCVDELVAAVFPDLTSASCDLFCEASNQDQQQQSKANSFHWSIRPVGRLCIGAPHCCFSFGGSCTL